jgi:spore coat polysaccharide biosynthesis protein SpsF
MRRGILIQARMSSSRFPGKMLKNIDGIPLVDFIYKRCAVSKRPDIIAVITSDHSSDDILYDHCVKKNIPVYRGSLENVLSRYIEASIFFKLDLICRVCGDSPLVDTELIDKMFDLMGEGQFDYIAPLKDRCIAGLDSEVMTLSALKKSLQMCTKAEELEHVTLVIKCNRNDFNIFKFDPILGLEVLKIGISLTVDLPRDLIFCNEIIKRINKGALFTSKDILSLISSDLNLQNELTS